MVRRVAFLFLLACVLAACGGEESSPPRTSPSPGTSLVVERADGSQIDMPGRPLVWCGPWNDLIPDHALHVAAVGDVERKRGEEWFSYWHLWAIPEHIESQAAVGFPGDYTFDDPSGVVLFVGDAETGNEASTNGDDSSGQIVFTKASCEVGDPVEFTVDAVVDSEFGDGDPVKVKGMYRGVVERSPEGYVSN
jgi:hypothetical protein